jgi:hypothetical protein
LWLEQLQLSWWELKKKEPEVRSESTGVEKELVDPKLIQGEASSASMIQTR